ncbi:hypothetical protein GCM10010350_74630 [Streptomyces galilaeus]|nr:hypothetical protein GCM10010350_74630 [Streptomyces galilaeus]
MKAPTDGSSPALRTPSKSGSGTHEAAEPLIACTEIRQSVRQRAEVAYVRQVPVRCVVDGDCARADLADRRGDELGRVLVRGRQ